MVLSARDAGALQSQADQLRAEYDVEVQVVAADLAVPEAPEDLAAAALQVFGGLDVLINNAGISQPELVVDLSADLLDDVITVNLRAPSRCAGLPIRLRSRPRPCGWRPTPRP